MVPLREKVVGHSCKYVVAAVVPFVGAAVVGGAHSPQRVSPYHTGPLPYPLFGKSVNLYRGRYCALRVDSPSEAHACRALFEFCVDGHPV